MIRQFNETQCNIFVFTDLWLQLWFQCSYHVADKPDRALQQIMMAGTLRGEQLVLMDGFLDKWP